MVYSVRMRRLSERARLEGMQALRKTLDGVRGGQKASPVPIPHAEAPPPVTPEPDRELQKGLDRIAKAIEGVAAQLDTYHQERAEHLEAIEFLLREMVIGTVPSAANRPIVLGGVVDAGIESAEREISLVVADDEALGIDAAVEVRSRFHDRWIGGFTIAEAVNAPGRRRYRLTRRSDGIPLPILFDACDVRAAEDAFSRQHAPS